ncbi:hypothetical protein K439DRAFT_1311860, partial [Ramaria rubella]
DFDILAIQEPHINFIGNSVSSPHWYSIYPKHHYRDSTTTCSLILVSKRLLTDSWEPVEIDSEDITAIKINSTYGDLLSINIY